MLARSGASLWIPRLLQWRCSHCFSQKIAVLDDTLYQQANYQLHVLYNYSLIAFFQCINNFTTCPLLLLLLWYLISVCCIYIPHFTEVWSVQLSWQKVAPVWALSTLQLLQAYVLTQQKVPISPKTLSPPFSFLFSLYTNIYFSLKEQENSFSFLEQWINSAIFCLCQCRKKGQYRLKLRG